MGEAVCRSVINQGIKVICMAVTELPRSGKPAELLALAQIDYAAIVQKVKDLLKQ